VNNVILVQKLHSPRAIKSELYLLCRAEAELRDEALKGTQLAEFHRDRKRFMGNLEGKC
jgi:hypothetical protein